jgi:hypothetical protein
LTGSVSLLHPFLFFLKKPWSLCHCKKFLLMKG